MKKENISRIDIVNTIEWKGTPRVPLTIDLWNPPEEFKEKAGDVLEIQAQYPADVAMYSPMMPGTWEGPAGMPDYRWAYRTRSALEYEKKKGLDSSDVIGSWDETDDFLDSFPDPEIPGLFDEAKKKYEPGDSRYRLLYIWFFYYERLWSLLGMENVLVGFYEHPAEIHRILRKLCDFYKRILMRSVEEFPCDGFYVTDDLGTQKGVMFSPEIFRSIFKPYYKEIIDVCHMKGMHFWFHTCGDVEEIMDDFIELGVNVIHPIQKYAMDEVRIAEKYSGRICFWAGMDLQHILPCGTPEDVRGEVRFLIDTYDRPDGGMIITAGNSIQDDVPIENLKAFYDEAYQYGMEHHSKME